MFLIWLTFKPIFIACLETETLLKHHFMITFAFRSKGIDSVRTFRSGPLIFEIIAWIDGLHSEMIKSFLGKNSTLFKSMPITSEYCTSPIFHPTKHLKSDSLLSLSWDHSLFSSLVSPEGYSWLFLGHGSFLACRNM